jgi:D-arabinose 1-dehydrogenase-like Zn-dependent alcohol dehydrogenase
VTKFKVYVRLRLIPKHMINQKNRGDRCGWGYQHSCCNKCKRCLQGTESFCPQKSDFGFHNFDQGSFGSGAVWPEDFVFHLPDGLTNAEAAPLSK